jgi:hypothetical protein
VCTGCTDGTGCFGTPGGPCVGGTSCNPGALCFGGMCQKQCRINPLLSFPNLQKDSATDCIYTPSLADVPLTYSALAYLLESVQSNIGLDRIQEALKTAASDGTDDLVDLIAVFVYVPIFVLLTIILLVLVIQGVFGWEVGLLLFAVIVVVFVLIYLGVRSEIENIPEKIITDVFGNTRDLFQGTQQEPLLCDLSKGLITAYSHLVIPNESICTSPTGTVAERCFPIVINDQTVEVESQEVQVKAPVDILNILYRCQKQTGDRCIGIDNQDDPFIDLIDAICKNCNVPNLNFLEGNLEEQILGDKTFVDCAKKTFLENALPFFPYTCSF